MTQNQTDNPNLPYASLVGVLVPDEILVVIHELFIARNKKSQIHNLKSKERISKNEVYVEVLRRGIESLYDGAHNVPVEKWDPFSYKYNKRKFTPSPIILKKDEQD
jgi:hypothetical protein